MSTNTHVCVCCSDLSQTVGASCQAHNTLCIRNTCKDLTIDIPVDRLNDGEEMVVALGSQFVWA